MYFLLSLPFLFCTYLTMKNNLNTLDSAQKLSHVHVPKPWLQTPAFQLPNLDKSRLQIIFRTSKAVDEKSVIKLCSRSVCTMLHYPCGITRTKRGKQNSPVFILTRQTNISKNHNPRS